MKWEDVEAEAQRWIDDNLRDYIIFESTSGAVIRVKVDQDFVPDFENHMWSYIHK